MRDHDTYAKTEDELISLLHLSNRHCLNQLTKHLSTKSLIDYICKDIIAKEADNLTPNNEDEKGGNEENFGEQS